MRLKFRFLSVSSERHATTANRSREPRVRLENRTYFHDGVRLLNVTVVTRHADSLSRISA